MFQDVADEIQYVYFHHPFFYERVLKWLIVTLRDSHFDQYTYYLACLTLFLIAMPFRQKILSIR